MFKTSTFKKNNLNSTIQKIYQSFLFFISTHICDKYINFGASLPHFMHLTDHSRCLLKVSQLNLPSLFYCGKKVWGRKYLVVIYFEFYSSEIEESFTNSYFPRNNKIIKFRFQLSEIREMEINLLKF